MGINLTPIIINKKIIKIKDLSFKTLAIDANNELYQFLSLIRMRNGTPLMDKEGRITSHLNGLMFRTTHLIYEYGIKPIFVFDGLPLKLKKDEIEKRIKIREKAIKEWEYAKMIGDYNTAYSKAVVSSKLTKDMVEDAKYLLKLLGLPYIQAPSDAEAQAAYMAKKGDVWASSSRDYDSLLFGTPRLVRYLTISGTEYLPSKKVVRPLKPEIIELDSFLKGIGINREQLVDIAILIGTDFNKGVKGIGPKKALKLIKNYGSIENLPEYIKSNVDENYEYVRKIFLNPQVTNNYKIEFGIVDENRLYEFLCEQRGFSRERVRKVVERMKRFNLKLQQTSLNNF